jgi:hypothetical protein
VALAALEVAAKPASVGIVAPSGKASLCPFTCSQSTSAGSGS